MSVSIATKPPTKRTAKGLILSGAVGKKARRDGRHPGHDRQTESMTNKGMSGIVGGITVVTSEVSLDRVTTGPVRGQLVHTTQSAGFDVTLPTHRRRVRNQRRQAQAAAAKLVELPQSVSASCPIVEVNSHDAWWLCGRARSRMVS